MFSRKVDVSECFEKWAGLDAAEEATRTESVKPRSDFDSPTDRYFLARSQNRGGEQQSCG